MRSFWPTGGLWRHRDFLKLWSAETVSQFGSQVGQLALPLVAILVLDASAFEVAALATVEFLPFILFTLPAGVWVDRLPRRPILIIGDFGRAALLATIPIAYLADVADARPALRRRVPRRVLPGLLRRRLPVVSAVARRPRRRSSRATRSSRSPARRRRSAGPGLGGILVQLFTAPYADPHRRRQLRRLGTLHPRNPQGGASAARSSTVDGRKTSLWYELKEGLRFVLGNPNLRAQAGCTATSNLFSSVAFSIILVFAIRELELSPGVIGLVLSIGAVGSLIGALHRRPASRIASASGRRRSPSPRSSGRRCCWSRSRRPETPPCRSSWRRMLVFGFTVVVYNIVQVCTGKRSARRGSRDG